MSDNYIKQFINSIRSAAAPARELDPDEEEQILLTVLLGSVYHRPSHLNHVSADILQLYNISGETALRIRNFVSDTSQEFLQDNDFAARFLREARQLASELNLKVIPKQHNTDKGAQNKHTPSKAAEQPDNADGTEEQGAKKPAKPAAAKPDTSVTQTRETNAEETLSESNENMASVKAIENVGGTINLALVDKIEQLYKYQHESDQLSAREKANIALQLLLDRASPDSSKLLLDLMQDKKTTLAFFNKIAHNDSILDFSYYTRKLRELYPNLNAKEMANLASAYRDAQRRTWADAQKTMAKLNRLLERDSQDDGKALRDTNTSELAKNVAQKIKVLTDLYNNTLKQAYMLERGLMSALDINDAPLSIDDIRHHLGDVIVSLESLERRLQSMADKGKSAEHVGEIIEEYNKAIRNLTTVSAQYFEDFTPHLSSLIQASVKKLGHISFDEAISENNMDLFRLTNTAEAMLARLQDLTSMPDALKVKYDKAGIPKPTRMRLNIPNPTEQEGRMKRFLGTLWKKRVSISAQRNVQKTADVEGAVALKTANYDPTRGDDMLIVPVADEHSLSKAYTLYFRRRDVEEAMPRRAERYKERAQQIVNSLVSKDSPPPSKPNTSKPNRIDTQRENIKRAFIKHLANMDAEQEKRKGRDDALTPCQALDLYKYLH